MPSRNGKAVPAVVVLLESLSGPLSRRLIASVASLLAFALMVGMAAPRALAQSPPTGRPPVAPSALPSTMPAPTSTPHTPHAAPEGSAMPPIPATLISPPPRGRLTLSEAIAIALARNPQIGAQRKNLEVSQARMQQSYSGYYPSVDIRASQTHSESQNSVFVAGEATAASSVGGQSLDVTSKRDNSSLQLSASQTVLDFGQRRLRVRAATQNVEASRQELVKAEQDVTLSVREAFFTAFVDQVLVDIKRQTVAQRAEHLRQAEGFYEAGVRAKNEVTKARSDLAQAQLDLVRAVGTLRTAWVNLNVSMGLPRDVTYELLLEGIDSINAGLDRQRLLAVALAQRPDLRRLQARIRSQIYTLEEVYAQRYPVISANAGYGWAGSPSPLDQAWNVGLRLDWNLFNGFLSRYQATEARATAESLLMQLEQTRQQVYQQVENDFIAFEQARAAIDAARVSLESAQENYRLARERYRVGLGSNLEFIDAQVLLAQAQTDLATAENELRTARARLEHDVGVFSVDELPAAGPPVAPDPIPGSTMKLPTAPP